MYIKIIEGIASPNVNQVQRVNARNICFVDDSTDATQSPYVLNTSYTVEFSPLIIVISKGAFKVPA